MAKNASHERSEDELPLRRIAGLGLGSREAGTDKLIHERSRLAICSALAVHPTLSFTELRDLLNATDGNLSVHAAKLEEEGLLRCTKSFQGRTPKTSFQLTRKGKRALDRYLDHMEALIRTVRG